MIVAVYRQAPTPLALNKADAAFLTGVALKILGNSNVAATNARRLDELGFNAHRIDTLIPWSSVAVQWDGFVFKKVEADEETPENFGLFVRRTAATSELLAGH